MSLLSFLRRRRRSESPDERRSRLLKSGRITDGVIIESETGESSDEVVVYTYVVHGAEFESSEVLTEEQLSESVKYAPGASVSVRFDPNNPGNSIVV